MDLYSIARVRFSGSGKAYPVNCVFNVEPGDFVIVRLEGHFTNLQMAEVVETDVLMRSCKHTVMCRAENAEDYGKGSDGVQTQEELVRFLTKGLRYHKYSVSDPPAPWHTFYVSYCGWQDPNDNAVRANFIIALGNDKVGYCGPGYPNPDGHYLRMFNGVITNIPLIAESIGPDRYKKAARFAENELTQPN